MLDTLFERVETEAMREKKKNVNNQALQINTRFRKRDFKPQRKKKIEEEETTVKRYREIKRERDRKREGEREREREREAEGAE